MRRFLFDRMYRAPSVMEKRAEVTQIIADLFPFFMAAPENLPRAWHEDIARADDETTLARLVSDYIAGMTDRYASQCHSRFITAR